VSEQQQNEPLPWWVHCCRWLRAKLPYVWGTLIVGTLVSTLANFNTLSTDTPLSKRYMVHSVLTSPIPVFSRLGFLLFLTLLSLVGSRKHIITTLHSQSRSGPLCCGASVCAMSK
jgi:hypothetical protein